MTASGGRLHEHVGLQEHVGLPMDACTQLAAMAQPPWMMLESLTNSADRYADTDTTVFGSDAIVQVLVASCHSFTRLLVAHCGAEPNNRFAPG